MSKFATIRWVVLESSVAANTRPTPAPGYRAAGPRLFYVTACGRSWLVRDEHDRVQLTPAALPRGARVLDECVDIELGIVAEAADLLDQRQPAGIYHVADHRVFYYLSERGDTWMLYGPDQALVRVPCLPLHAALVDLPPRAVTAAIVHMEEAG